MHLKIYADLLIAFKIIILEQAGVNSVNPNMLKLLEFTEFTPTRRKSQNYFLKAYSRVLSGLKIHPAPHVCGFRSASPTLQTFLPITISQTENVLG